MSFERLVQIYDKRVLSLAYQLLGNTQDAEDVYQDAFMRAFHNIKQFRFDSDFYTWLYRIVVNCAISYRKTRSRHRHRSIDASAEQEIGWHWTPVDPLAGPDVEVSNLELREQINDNLDKLPLMQRVVFTLRFFQDFKIKDIAKIIDCSEGTVKNYLFRSTHKMRKQLTPYLKGLTG